jgi:phosphohistidine swiveling domain-containing protein
MALIESYGRIEWIKHWAGHWSLLSCSYFGHQYTKTIKETLGVCLQKAMFVSKEGFSVCYLHKSEVLEFGKSLADKVVKNKKFCPELCNDLKEKTDIVINTMERLKGKDLTQDEFKEFMKDFYDYVSPHIAIKKLVDFLPADVLEKLLPQFSDARVYAEKVYTESEIFMRSFANVLSKKNGYASHLLLCLMKEELEEYFKLGKLPSKDILEDRYKEGALLFNKGKYDHITGSLVKELEELVTESLLGEKVIKGVTAYPGKIRGKVRIIFKPEEVHDFKKGEILVTGMTRPEYTHLIDKAAGFITDAGGMLSHAAILAREMKKPCVVGTEIATKVLKDGMEVEIDAEKGIVKILK